MKTVWTKTCAVGLAIAFLGASQLAAAQPEASCDGIVTSDPKHMYDFKIGTWNLRWKNQYRDGFAEFDAVSKVYTMMDGDIVMDEQVAQYFKGVTFRTYDKNLGEWVVRWLPANSTWYPPISASLEDCTPVERHVMATPTGENAKVRTRFTDITANSFAFHQDWSTDGGKSWNRDVLYYEATRVDAPESAQ
ncbi:MAG: hypothetical protein GXP06_13065 [Alphaproteobacteria bacterium]|nr:hypothetical protein [Alphaproteobacteria bacterium]